MDSLSQIPTFSTQRTRQQAPLMRFRLRLRKPISLFRPRTEPARLSPYAYTSAVHNAFPGRSPMGGPECDNILISGADHAGGNEVGSRSTVPEPRSTSV